MSFNDLFGWCFTPTPCIKMGGNWALLDETFKAAADPLMLQQPGLALTDNALVTGTWLISLY